MSHDLDVTAIVRKVGLAAAQYAKKHSLVPAGILIGCVDYLALRQLALAARDEKNPQVIKDLATPLKFEDDTKLLYFNGMAVYPYSPGGKVKILPKMQDVPKLI